MAVPTLVLCRPDRVDRRGFERHHQTRRATTSAISSVSPPDWIDRATTEAGRLPLRRRGVLERRLAGAVLEHAHVDRRPFGRARAACPGRWRRRVVSVPPSGRLPISGALRRRERPARFRRHADRAPDAGRARLGGADPLAPRRGRRGSRPSSAASRRTATSSAAGRVAVYDCAGGRLQPDPAAEGDRNVVTLRARRTARPASRDRRPAVLARDDLSCRRHVRPRCASSRSTARTCSARP